MILKKKFDCTTDDLDSVIVSVAKEIEDGWHIGKIEVHDFHTCYAVKKTEPDFSIELVRKDVC
jgi:hypothetical protein